jgi:hypothetical protein
MNAAAGLDTVVVVTPVDDGFLDGLLIYVFCEGSVGQLGKFVVGGEAEADELGDGEPSMCAVGFGEQSVEGEALFETDDAVLGLRADSRALPGPLGGRR